MRLRKKLLGILLLSVLAFCCGCAANPTKEDKIQEKASSSPTMAPAPTDAASVSAVFKNSGDTVKKKRLENDFIRVYLKDKAGILTLENLDGADQREIAIENLYKPFWLTNDWLYYATIDLETNIEVFYRAPVAQDNDSGTVDISRQEKLFQGEAIEYNDFMLTDSYILYSPYTEDDRIEIEEGDFTDSPFFRYDLETGKSNRIGDLTDSQNIVYDAATELPVLLGEHFFITDYYKGIIYRVSIDTLEKKVCFSDGIIFAGEVPGAMTEYQGDLYILSMGMEYGLWKYDGDSGEETCLLSGKRLEKIVEKMNLWKKKAENKQVQVLSMWIDQDNIYLSARMNCYVEETTEDEPRKKVKNYHTRDILLSAKLSDSMIWKLEKKVTAILKDGGAYTYLVSDGTVCLHFASFEDKDKPPTLYHISTGEMEELKETDYRFWGSPILSR